ncbi:MAG: FKBP-type peptidyl-prolyl cis-trans isomerase [Alphaproteobacteria bacterium]|nr:FKBP-type peptidyl-prolyl cis-trans isomerase [Alphaproteobacteria bacterium]
MLILALALAAAAAPAAHSAPPPAMRGVVTTASGLRFRTLKPGRGGSPGPADTAIIDYEGRLTDGKVFDQAKNASLPVARVVPGFAEALQLMHQGGTYRIWIPPQLAYGDKGAGGGAVPPGATLDFTVTMNAIVKGAASQP